MLPKLVYVPVVRYVQVPAELSKDCDVYQVKASTYGEAVTAANKRKAALEECNKRLASIRNLGESP